MIELNQLRLYCSINQKDDYVKNNTLKRIPAVVVTVAILFSTVFSMSVFANAASSFTPRLSAPPSSNKYYYSNLNLFYKYGYGMPNCTAYAYGRAYEILGSEPNLCRYSAEEWYDYNKKGDYYDYGKTPKLGAIACWYYDNGGGHVAVVEKIENGTITFSNSAYSGENFYLSHASTSDKNAGGNSWWNFQGYIYIIDNVTPDTTAPITKTGVYKTDVDDYLNMRSGAGTSYSYVTSVPDGALLNVTQIKQNDGYTWGYTAYNGKSGWVALDFCIYISELPTTQPTTEKPATQPTTAKPTTQPTTAPTTTLPVTEPTTEKPTIQPTTEPPETQPTTNPQEGLGVGDVNGDGVIGVTDSTLIQKYLSGLAQLSDKQISWCDADFNGKVDINDASTLQKYLAFYKRYS